MEADFMFPICSKKTVSLIIRKLKMACLKLHTVNNTDLKISWVNKCVRSAKSDLNLRSVYLYGFNGKETDKETDLQDYGMRIYNPSLGRFLSVDPLTKGFPELTPYQFASNRPIDGVDWDGLEYVTVHILIKDGQRTELRRENHYQTMTNEQIQEIHGMSAADFYKKYSAAFEKEGRGVKYVYYNEVNGQNVPTGDISWESRQKLSFPWSESANFRRHGIWAGSGGITVLGVGGPPPSMDKSFGHIDQIDKLAYDHDLFYDYEGYEDGDFRNNFSDAAIAADKALLAGFEDYVQKVDASRDKDGNITYVDPVTGRAASEEAYATAKLGSTFFRNLVKEKEEKKANGESTEHNKK
jgi:RHS repeat-associated protein